MLGLFKYLSECNNICYFIRADLNPDTVKKIMIQIKNQLGSLTDLHYIYIYIYIYIYNGPETSKIKILKEKKTCSS